MNGNSFERAAGIIYALQALHQESKKSGGVVDTSRRSRRVLDLELAAHTAGATGRAMRMAEAPRSALFNLSGRLKAVGAFFAENAASRTTA